MVIGNGLLAKAFSSYKDNEDVIIYASGVSNSKEESDYEFERELSKLNDYILNNNNKLLIYFSTCSVNDDFLKDTKYVNHKIKIENLISENVSNFIIFRLPIVIGNTENKFTLYNFLLNKLSNNEELVIQKNAYRYIVDIEDVYTILSKMIDSRFFLNSVIDVSFSEKISVLNIVEQIKQEVNSKSKIKIIEGGSKYDINTFIINSFMEKNEILISKNYNENILKKYIKYD